MSGLVECGVGLLGRGSSSCVRFRCCVVGPRIVGLQVPGGPVGGQRRVHV